MRDGDGVSRRSCLAIASGLGVAGLSGCLRFAESATGSTPDGTPQSSDTPEPTEGDGDTPEGEDNTYDVDRFLMDSLWSDGMMRETDTLAISNGIERVDVDGSWVGNNRMFDEQACGRYSFELLEDGEVIARTGETILIVGYNFAMDQTEESVFVTYQPSVNEDWDIQLLLRDGDVEYSLSPTILSSRSVFEFDLTSLDAEPGEYEWEMQIAPVSDGSRTGFPTLVGTFHDRVVYVPPYSDGFYSSREEAIGTAAELANSSAASVSPPETWQPDGLEIVGSLHHGGTSGGERHLSKDFHVDCRPTHRFGSSVDRTFRATNHTLRTSNVFEPE